MVRLLQAFDQFVERGDDGFQFLYGHMLGDFGA
jgi:hypothetical protein